MNKPRERPPVQTRAEDKIAPSPAAVPVFSLPVRAYYQHTDAGGVVHHTHYLNFMEHARTEWLRALGFSQPDLTRVGVMFAVRAAKLDFLKPARLDDALHATVRLLRQGGASLVLDQRVYHDQAVLCQGEVKLACLDVNSFSPVLIPDAIDARLGPWRTA